MPHVRVMMTVNAAWNVWNFRRPVVRALLEEGRRITVLAPPDATVSYLEQAGCRFLPLPMTAKGVNPFEGIDLVRRFRTAFAAERPDVVLSYTIKNNLFGALAARASGVPFIPNVTGLGTAFISRLSMRIAAQTLYRLAFRKLPVVFFQNADDLAFFIDSRLVTAGQGRLLPGSGIDLARFAPAAYPGPSAPVFLMISRLLRDKGVVEFVEAARHVKSLVPSARFQLLGPIGSDNRSAIDESTLRGWIAEGVVEYLGVAEDVRPFIAAAQCVVLPSYREGAPRTLIEASAMARPVIATDVPGCRSVVDANLTGLLCAPRDAASLSDAMLRFTAMPHAMQAALGAAGRRKMEREFDDALVVAAYRAAIAQVTGSAPSDALPVQMLNGAP